MLPMKRDGDMNYVVLCGSVALKASPGKLIKLGISLAYAWH